MKKIIALLLLLILSVETSCFATEIIVGADGQARYADGKETPVELDVKAVKPESVDDKTLIKTNEELNKKIAPYKKKNLKIIKEADKTINYQNALRLRGRLNLSTLIIRLQDGDYVLWNPTKAKEQYAVEYHKNHVCMGVVKIKKINKETLVIYEYRIDSKEAIEAPLKHILIAYYDKHNAVFIYTANGELRNFSYNGENYAIDLSNIIPVITNLNIEYLGSKPPKDIDWSEIGDFCVESAQMYTKALLLAPALPLLFLYYMYARSKAGI